MTGQTRPDGPAVEYPALDLPAHVSRQSVHIWSNGLRIDADLYKPRRVLGTTQKVPAIVMSHGLGGSKLTAERYAAELADAGMIALAFTHAGWSGSDAPAYVEHSKQDAAAGQDAEPRVRFATEVIDPLEWVQTFRVAVDYIEGEDNVDTSRIGAWGTSFGGGVGLFNACNDDRIKALAIQVAWVAGVPPALVEHARRGAIDMARGVLPSVPDGSTGRLPKVPGALHFPRLRAYRPLGEIAKLEVPVLMVDAGNEDMFDIRENAGAVRDHLERQGRVPFLYRVIPGIDHYGIYFDGYAESASLARSWFTTHLLKQGA
ncbi:acetylxylan esterase [Variovorax paradoxus]|nr:CocE/NonD family hydrolase [Variovorax paradoxus]MBT2302064.1 acetylxylan esterase [Variovorax paradoxus]